MNFYVYKKKPRMTNRKDISFVSQASQQPNRRNNKTTHKKKKKSPFELL